METEWCQGLEGIAVQAAQLLSKSLYLAVQHAISTENNLLVASNLSNLATAH